MVEFFRARLLEREHLATLRIDAGHDVFDGAVFACGVHGLKDQENGVTVIGIEAGL